MSTDRTRRLSPGELALKLACREAVKAAGGQEFVAQETGRTQSRISDYCSPNTADFMPIEVVKRVEALSDGAPGHPHITRALARAQGLTVSEPIDLERCGGTLGQWLGCVAGESSDLIRALAAGAVVPGLARQAYSAMPPADRATIVRELDQLIDVLAGLNQALGEVDSP